MRLQTVGARRAIDYRISVGYFGMLNSTKNLFKNTQPPPLFEGFFASGLSHKQETAAHSASQELEAPATIIRTETQRVLKCCAFVSQAAAATHTSAVCVCAAGVGAGG